MIFSKIVPTLLVVLSVSIQNRVEGKEYNQNKAFPKADVDYKLGMKALIVSKGDDSITSDPSLLAKAYFEGLGVPYEISSELPAVTGKNGEYNVVVMAENDAKYSAQEIAAAEEYSRKYKARIVFMHLTQYFDNFDLIPLFDDVDASSNTEIVFDDTLEAKVVADIMNTSSAWSAENLAPYAYRPASLTSNNFTTVMRYQKKNLPLKSKAVAALICEKNGAEMMFFFFNAAENAFDQKLNIRTDAKLKTDDFTSFNLAVANMWYTWASRGVFMGQRRIPVQLHIDDWYLQSDVYKSKDPFRIDGQDTIDAVAWIDGLNDKLGLHPDSNVTVEIVYNGAGIAQQGYTDQSLVEATAKYADRFNFVSHTWTHQNLDWIDAWACDGKSNVCQPDYRRIMMELNYNLKAANGEEVVPEKPWFGYAKTPADSIFGGDQKLKNARFSRHSLVCPEISGLRPASQPEKGWSKKDGGRKPNPKNEVLFRALNDMQIKAVVADNTISYMLNQKNVHHGVKSTKNEYGYEGVLIIPRWAVNIDYNLHTFELLEEYWNKEKICWWMQYDSECGKWIGDYTAEEALDIDALQYVPYSLALRQDSFMFHQANMKSNERNGEKMSLVAAWIEQWLKRITKHVVGLPFQSPRMDDVFLAYLEREERDECKPEGELTIDSNGNVKGVQLEATTGTASCKALLTVIGETNQLKRSIEDANAGLFSQYGNDYTMKVGLKKGDKVYSKGFQVKADTLPTPLLMGVDINGDFFPLDTLPVGVKVTDQVFNYNGVQARVLQNVDEAGEGGSTNAASGIAFGGIKVMVSALAVVAFNMLQ